jgi:hypothetical protein
MFAGINNANLVVAMNNSEANLDVKNKLSRGGLVLDALTFPSAEKAAQDLYQKIIEIQSKGVRRKSLLPINDAPLCRYPAFNLIIADRTDAYVIFCGPKEMMPFEVIKSQPGQINSFRIANDSTPIAQEVSLIGDIGGKEIVVSCERLPSKKAVMICGWAPNDQRSQRVQNFLPTFEKLIAEGIKEGKTPKADRLDSWTPWLELMQDQSKGQGGAFHASIAQPPFEIFETISGSSNKKTWATIGTSLFAITHKNRETEARMYYSPGPPTLEHPMEFQRIKSGWPTIPKPENRRLTPPSKEGEEAKVTQIESNPQRIWCPWEDNSTRGVKKNDSRINNRIGDGLPEH